MSLAAWLLWLDCYHVTQDVYVSVTKTERAALEKLEKTG